MHQQFRDKFFIFRIPCFIIIYHRNKIRPLKNKSAVINVNKVHTLLQFNCPSFTHSKRCSFSLCFTSISISFLFNFPYVRKFSEIDNEARIITSSIKKQPYKHPSRKNDLKRFEFFIYIFRYRLRQTPPG